MHQGLPVSQRERSLDRLGIQRVRHRRGVAELDLRLGTLDKKRNHNAKRNKNIIKNKNKEMKRKKKNHKKDGGEMESDLEARGEFGSVLDPLLL